MSLDIARREISAFAGMTSLETWRLQLPCGRLRKLLSPGAAMPCLIERGLEPADDQPAHRCRVTEAHLGLGGMHIYIDISRWHFDEQSGDRVPVPCQQVAIGCTQRPDQQAILHRP